MKLTRVVSFISASDISGIDPAQSMVEQKVITIPLVQLQQSMDMPLVQLWLALLMGEHLIEQHGEFYETEQIWVTAQGDSRGHESGYRG